MPNTHDNNNNNNNNNRRGALQYIRFSWSTTHRGDARLADLQHFLFLDVLEGADVDDSAPLFQPRRGEFVPLGRHALFIHTHTEGG